MNVYSSRSRYLMISTVQMSAPRAFKDAPVVTEAVRLDASEAHISVADAARMRDHPQLRKYLIPSHVSHPSFFDGFFTIAVAVTI